MIGVFVTLIRVVYGTMIYMPCALLKESITSFGVSLMKSPMEHYLDDLCPSYKII